ncbi:MAG: GTP-binding protein [Thermoplasmata archaeon]|nr:GTP-binding protein [Thermoplasmata archaeon]
MKKFAKKIVLLGDSAVGKTSLIRKFVHEEFDDSYISTIGTKVSKKEMRVNIEGEDILMNLMIWDMLGREGYMSAQARQMVGAQGVIIVGDLTRLDTIKNMEKYWIPLLLRTIGSINLPIVFMANKSDIANEDTVMDAVDIFSRYERNYNHGLKEILPEDLNTWFLTSAKTGEKVEDAFSTMVHMTYYTNRAKDPFFDRIRDLTIKRIGDQGDRDTLVGVVDLIIYEFSEVYGNSVKAGRILREEVARAGMDHNNPTKESVVELVNYLIEAAGEGNEDLDLLKAKHKEWNELIEKVQA